jgi:hypothetical protein
MELKRLPLLLLASACATNAQVVIDCSRLKPSFVPK